MEGKALERRRLELAEEQTSVNWPGRRIPTGPRQHPELERLCGNDGQAQRASSGPCPRGHRCRVLTSPEPPQPGDELRVGDDSLWNGLRASSEVRHPRASRQD